MAPFIRMKRKSTKKPRPKVLAFFIKADNYAVVSIMVPLFASIAVGAFGAGAFAFTD